MTYDTAILANASIRTANENMPLTPAQDILTREAIIRDAADVRILDCLGGKTLIHVQHGAAPVGRGVEAFGGADRYLLTDRAWKAFRATRPDANIVCDF